MFETRLINQVVVWERILESENEKKNNLHPKAQSYSPGASESRVKGNNSIVTRIFKLGQTRNFSTHSSEPA